MIASVDDDVAPSPRLLELGLAAAAAAREIDLSALSRRLERPPYWPDVWPGEHYRLLAGLVATTVASTVVEIGTATGLSALALLHSLGPDGRVVTFDVVPWA